MTMAWMRRYDVTWVEVLFCVGILAGFASLVTPAHVHSIITLSSYAATHPAIALAVVVVALGVTVYRIAVTWGPVRTSPAAARWMLSGPSTRAGHLTVRLLKAELTTTAALFAGTGIVSLLAPSVLGPIFVMAAVCAVAAGVAGWATQVIADRRHHPVPAHTGHRWWSLDSLHHSTFAPRDGYHASLGIAVSMMDASWIDDARIIRWQRRSRSAAGHLPLTCTAAGALIRLEIRRLRRHRTTVLRWAICIATGVLLFHFTAIHLGAYLAAASIAYASGLSVTGGLRQTAANAALRRALGRSDRFVIACQSFVPAIAVAVCCAVTLPLVPVSAVQAVTLYMGVVFAVIRRGTRSALPYDSVVMTDPVTGAALQPLMILAQLRGIVAVAGTALIAGLV